MSSYPKYNQPGMDPKYSDYSHKLVYYYEKEVNGCVEFTTYDGISIEKLDRAIQAGRDDENKIITCVFKLPKSYTKIETELINFYKKSIEWNKVIIKQTEYDQDGKKRTPFNFHSKYTDNGAILTFFNYICKKNYTKYNFQDIESLESEYIELPSAGGLIYCDPTNKDFSDVISYDRNHFYQWALGNPDSKLMIPKKAGKEYKLDSMPQINDLKFGMYNIEIKSSDPNFPKIFFTTRTNWYNFYEVRLIMKLMKKKKFDISFKLINEGVPNAYLYEWCDVINSNEIFGEWYNTLIGIKQNDNKNGLVKCLGSMCWGVISQLAYEKIDNEKYMANPDYYDENYSNHKTKLLGERFIDGKPNPKFRKIFYLLRNGKQLYKVPNMRVKGIINSYCKTLMAQHIIESGLIDHVVRIHTDSISIKLAGISNNYKSTKGSDVGISYFMNDLWKQEEKTTGIIQFKNCNDYLHKCPKCGEALTYYYFLLHKCQSSDLDHLESEEF